MVPHQYDIDFFRISSDYVIDLPLGSNVWLNCADVSRVLGKISVCVTMFMRVRTFVCVVPSDANIASHTGDP